MAAVLAGPAAAQTTDQKAVQQAVESFLLHLGDHEFDKVAADLTPKAIIVIARERDSQWSNSFQTGEEWVAALKKNPNPITFREPLTNVTVTIDDGHLAFLRADFQVMRDGKAQSHGIDEFTLVRDGTAWKIAVVAYTSMPAAR
jgi:ketosteroid isomerase-like protein